MSIENPMPKRPHSSGVLCVISTYRSAGAEVLVRLAAIDMLLRWSKEVPSIMLGFNFVAFNTFNRSDEPISYIQLTFEKNCPNFSILSRTYAN